jgi:hypothetical protein
MAKSLYARVLFPLLTTIADTSALAASFDCAKPQRRSSRRSAQVAICPIWMTKGACYLPSMVAWTASSHDL